MSDPAIIDQKHVIIDGFNVIFGDRRLHKEFRTSQDGAKKSLVEMAQAVHDIDGCQVSVIFDGQGNSISVENPLRGTSFSVIHSSSNVSADGVIERMLARSRLANRLIVVTDDGLIQDATRVCGAEAMRVESFLDWVRTCARKSLANASRRQLSSDREWGNRLPL
jgi:predicted RNA-binding protein with PIN domain